jgi:hypothetical protein
VNGPTLLLPLRLVPAVKKFPTPFRAGYVFTLK